MSSNFPGSADAYGASGLHKVNFLGISELTTAITSGSTTFTVASASTGTTWPADNFAVRIGDEDIFVSSRTGAVCTIGARAHDNTAQADHAIGDDVRVVMDSDALMKMSDAIIAIETYLLSGGTGLNAADNETITGAWTFDNTLTMANGRNIVVGTSTGTKIGTATGQKLGFFNAAPVIQRSDFGALTDSTGQTPDNTIENVPDPADTPADADALRDDLVANTLPAIERNLSDLADQINAIRTVLRDLGFVA